MTTEWPIHATYPPRTELHVRPDCEFKRILDAMLVKSFESCTPQNVNLQPEPHILHIP